MPHCYLKSWDEIWQIDRWGDHITQLEQSLKWSLRGEKSWLFVNLEIQGIALQTIYTFWLYLHTFEGHMEMCAVISWLLQQLWGAATMW